MRISLLVAAASLAAASAACSSASDCSLNGDCVNASCVCDPQWSGSPTCDVLSLRPAVIGEGYRNASASSWGGMSIRDDAGAWHLVAAEMVNGCALGSWKTNSRVVRGVGAAPGGPFAVVQEISAPFSHNPKIIRAPDGTYLLFSIGSGLWRTTPEQCAAGRPAQAALAAAAAPTPGPCGDGCGPESEGLNGGCGISLGTAPSPAGPWTFAPLRVTNQSQSALLDCMHTNPSPWIFPNGSIIMAINAGWCHNYLETIGLLTAPSYAGPWTFMNGGEPILYNADGSVHKAEDPFIYASPRGLHLLVHNMEGGNGPALYAHSADGGAHWVLHNEPGNPGPYSGAVAFSDGSAGNFDVERPQFVFAPAPPGEYSAPLYLTNGAAQGSASFTLFRPLWQTPPPPPPPPRRLRSATTGLCLAPAGPWPPGWGRYGIAPLAAAPCAGAPAWALGADGALTAASLGGASAPVLNLDCDACTAGTGAKLILSGASPLAVEEGPGQIRAAACGARGAGGAMCLTTGAAAGARAPCGGGSEPWSPTQVHLAPCSSSDTVGWAWEDAV